MMHNEMFQLTKGDVISRCLISGMKKEIWGFRCYEIYFTMQSNS